MYRRIKTINIRRCQTNLMSDYFVSKMEKDLQMLESGYQINAIGGWTHWLVSFGFMPLFHDSELVGVSNNSLDV